MGRIYKSPCYTVSQKRFEEKRELRFHILITVLIYLYIYKDIIQENYTYMLSQYYSKIYINKEECL